MISFEEFMRQQQSQDSSQPISSASNNNNNSNSNNNNNNSNVGGDSDSLNLSLSLSSLNGLQRQSASGQGRVRGGGVGGGGVDVSGVLFEDPNDSSVIEDTSFYKNTHRAILSRVGSSDDYGGVGNTFTSTATTTYNNNIKNKVKSGLEINDDDEDEEDEEVSEEDEVEYEQDFEEDTLRKSPTAEEATSGFFDDALSNNDNDNSYNTNSYNNHTVAVKTPTLHKKDMSDETDGYTNDFYVSPFTPADKLSDLEKRLGGNSTNSLQKPPDIMITAASTETPIVDHRDHRNHHHGIVPTSHAEILSKYAHNAAFKHMVTAHDKANSNDNASSTNIAISAPIKITSYSSNNNNIAHPSASIASPSVGAHPLSSKVKVVLNHSEIPGLSLSTINRSNRSHFSSPTSSTSPGGGEDYVRRDEIDSYIKQSLDRQRKSSGGGGINDDKFRSLNAISEVSIPVKAVNNAFPRNDVIRTGMFSPNSNRAPIEHTVSDTLMDFRTPIDYVEEHYIPDKMRNNIVPMPYQQEKAEEKEKDAKLISKPTMVSHDPSQSANVNGRANEERASKKDTRLAEREKILVSYNSNDNNNSSSNSSKNITAQLDQFDFKDDFRSFVQLSLANPDGAEAVEGHLSALMAEIIDVCQKHGQQLRSPAEFQMHRVVLQEIQSVLFSPETTKSLMLRMLEAYVAVEGATKTSKATNNNNNNIRNSGKSKK